MFFYQIASPSMDLIKLTCKNSSKQLYPTLSPEAHTTQCTMFDFTGEPLLHVIPLSPSSFPVCSLHSSIIYPKNKKDENTAMYYFVLQYVITIFSKE